MSSSNTTKEIIVFAEGRGNCGIMRVLSELTDAWCGKGCKVTIAYIDKKDEQNKEKEDDYQWNECIEMIPLPTKASGLGLYFGLVPSYFKLLKQRKNAVAISLAVSTNFAMGACAPFVKNKIIISDRNDPTQRPKNRIKQLIRNLAFKQADVLVLQTEDVLRYYQKHINRTGVVIPNPINGDLPNRFTGQRKKVIVTASRLNKQKNLPMLIRAFAKLSAEYPEYTLEIFGRGEDEESLRELVSQMELDTKVVFRGFSKDLYHDILDCAMYICPSNYEGISNSLIEALGLGLPTISTDCPVGGSRMLIDNGENGILIPVGDQEALYQKMKQLIDQPALAERLSANAVNVRERFEVDHIAQMWLDQM